MIVLTDGRNNLEDEGSELFVQSRAAQADGIIMYVIGVTDQADPYELRLMSSPPHEKNRNWWMLNNFSDLETIVGKIAATSCLRKYAFTSIRHSDTDCFWAAEG